MGYTTIILYKVYIILELLYCQGSLYHSCCTVYTAVIETKCKLYYRCCNVYITAIGYTVFTISQLSNEYILFQYMYGVYNSHKKLYSVHYITVVGQYIK